MMLKWTPQLMGMEVGLYNTARLLNSFVWCYVTILLQRWLRVVNVDVSTSTPLECQNASNEADILRRRKYIYELMSRSRVIFAILVIVISNFSISEVSYITLRGWSWWTRWAFVYMTANQFDFHQFQTLISHVLQQYNVRVFVLFRSPQVLLLAHLWVLQGNNWMPAG